MDTSLPQRQEAPVIVAGVVVVAAAAVIVVVVYGTFLLIFRVDFQFCAPRLLLVGLWKPCSIRD